MSNFCFNPDGMQLILTFSIIIIIIELNENYCQKLC